jgi:ATP-binding cassette, subfamily B, bacterial PglK
MQIQLTVLLRRLWQHLENRRHKQFFFLLILTLVSSILEVISLGAVIPFIGALTSPEKLFAQSFIVKVSMAFGIDTAQQLALPFTILFVVAALVAASTRLLLLWARNRLAYASGADISKEVYRRTLYQTYDVHLTQNSSEIISGITTKVSVVVGVFNHLLILITSVVLLVFIMVTLIAINPFIAFVITIGFGLAYYIVASLSRRQLKLNSRIIAEGSTDLIKVLQEGLGGIRDITLNGSQQMYCELHGKADYKLRKAMGNNNYISGSPRYIMEGLGMILIAALAYTLSLQTEGIESALPLLGALALGAQRLLPALQQSFSAWAAIVGSQASLVDLLQLLNKEIPKEFTIPIATELSFGDAIHLDTVSFRYTNDGPWVLKDLSLKIHKGNRIGIVANTGCGKSTTLDILMGLLMPSKGQLLIDGITLNNELLRGWQQNIAHVPQSIYLSDNTIAENIAFGVPVNDIDIVRVKLAAQRANIAEFIENKPNGYQELVGERGIRLSGGQSQRIGIARSLYKKATVLIFDEATSALDNSTEKSIMEAIAMLSRDLTIIIVAHRITTVQHCDVIFELDKGRVVAQGSYQELLKNSISFRKTVNITSITK